MRHLVYFSPVFYLITVICANNLVCSAEVGSVAYQVNQQIEWVQIPGGKFLMGSTAEEIESFYKEARLRSSTLDRHTFEAERPQRWVVLSNFEISKYEITNAQYRSFVEATHRPIPRGHKGESVWQDELMNQNHQPVVGITWYDAQAFAEWIGASLPSEAQWERVARGEYGFRYPWGNAPPTRTSANFARRHQSTVTVGTYPEGDTAEGVSDMAGNVWEWCLDAYDPHFYATSKEQNPVNQHDRNFLEDRVIRGGSWIYGRIFMRSALRFKFYPLSTANDVGFRVVRQVANER